MARCPFAEWRGPLPATNYAPGPRTVIGVTVHHMDGSLASAEGRFMTPGAGASACFGVRYDGSIVQWVDTDDIDYHACGAQWHGYVGIENESDPAQPDAPPTVAQIAAMGRIIAWLGIPTVAATSPVDGGGVGYHRQFPGTCTANDWGSTACPGQGFVDAIPAILAAATGTNPTQPKKGTAMELLISPTRALSHTAGVLDAQFPNPTVRVNDIPTSATTFLAANPGVQISHVGEATFDRVLAKLAEPLLDLNALATAIAAKLPAGTLSAAQVHAELVSVLHSAA